MEKDFEIQRRAKKHIHMYERRQTKLRPVWMCGDPFCTHHMPAHMDELLVGRVSLCNNCFQQMILDEDKLKQDKPFCDTCLRQLQGEWNEQESMEQFFEDKGTLVDKLRP